MDSAWEDVRAFLSVNGETLFFTLITLVIATAAIMDIRDKNYPPGPLGFPIFGYLPFLRNSSPHLALTELTKHYGRVYSIKLGSVYAVVISDLKLIRDAFSQDVFSVRPSSLYLNHGFYNPRGLMSGEGEDYKNQRSFITTTLNDLRSQGGKLESRIQGTVQEFLQDIRNYAGQPIPMNEIVLHHVGNALSDIILGEKFGKEDESWTYLKLALKQHFTLFSPTNFLNYVPWLRHFSKYAQMIADLKKVKLSSHGIYKNLMEKNSEKYDSRIKSILDAYVAKMKTTSEVDVRPENVREVLSDLLSISWETTSTTLQWLYLYMATNPEIQERASSEICAVIGNNSEASLKDIEKMPYTKACVLEILRHRTVFPLGVPHGTTEKSQIGGFWIPKGSMIIPLLYALHHDERVWERPEEFIPERHLDSQGCLSPQENILPFQSGKRSCIGEDIARNMILLFFVNTISQVRFNVPKGASLSVDQMTLTGLTLSPQSFCLQAQAR